jgi:hypothetical protein
MYAGPSLGSAGVIREWPDSSSKRDKDVAWEQTAKSGGEQISSMELLARAAGCAFFAAVAQRLVQLTRNQ